MAEIWEQLMSLGSPSLNCPYESTEHIINHLFTVPTRHDKDRAILAYDSATDRCNELHAFSPQEDRDAADWACQKAFEALDEIKVNSCNGWRQAKCRPIVGVPHKQCSCRISMCNNIGIRSNIIKTFQECGADLWTDGLFVGGIGPSDRFERASTKIANDLEEARSLRRRLNSGARVRGTSHGGTSYYAPHASTSYGGAPHASTSYAGTSHDGANLGGALYGGISYAGTFYDAAPYGGPFNASTTYLGNAPAGTSESGNAQGVVPREGSSSQPRAAAENAGPALGRVIQDLHEPVMEGPALECPHGGKAHWTKDSHAQHVRSHVLSTKTCKHCNRSYSTRSNYNTHMKSQHLKEFLAAKAAKAADKPKKKPPEKIGSLGAGGKLFGCDICGREYKNARLLHDHRISHAEVLICKMCTKSFTSKMNFDTHIRKRHPDYEAATANISATDVVNAFNDLNSIICPICHRRFSNDKSFSQHMTGHTTDSTTCKLCNRAYSTVSSYNYHMRQIHPESTSASVPRRGRQMD